VVIYFLIVSEVTKLCQVVGFLFGHLLLSEKFQILLLYRVNFLEHIPLDGGAARRSCERSIVGPSVFSINNTHELSILHFLGLESFVGGFPLERFKEFVNDFNFLIAELLGDLWTCVEKDSNYCVDVPVW
jgi:hypothetical protein